MVRIKKAGFFYSLGFYLLAGLILSLAILSYKNYNLSRDRFNEILELDKVYEIDKSIQEGFRDIFNLKSGIIINKGESITFNENLPNQNKDNFNNFIEEYKTFLESNFSVMINVNELKTRLPLKIKPHDIEYYHENFGGLIVKADAASSNFKGFTITVTTSETLDGTSCVSSGTNQEVYLNIFATGSSGSCSETSNSISNINLENSKNELIATVSVSGNDLVITSFKTINITTSVDSLDDLGNTFVYFPDELLYLNYSIFDITKNSTVILL